MKKFLLIKTWLKIIGYLLLLSIGVYMIQPGRTLSDFLFNTEVAECTIPNSNHKIRLYLNNGGATVSFSSIITSEKSIWNFEKTIFKSYSYPIIEKITCRPNFIELFSSKESLIPQEQIPIEKIAFLTKEPISYYKGESKPFGGFRDFPVSKQIFYILGLALTITGIINLYKTIKNNF